MPLVDVSRRPGQQMLERYPMAVLLPLGALLRCSIMLSVQERACEALLNFNGNLARLRSRARRQSAFRLCVARCMVACACIAQHAAEHMRHMSDASTGAMLPYGTIRAIAANDMACSVPKSYGDRPAWPPTAHRCVRCGKPRGAPVSHRIRVHIVGGEASLGPRESATGISHMLLAVHPSGQVSSRHSWNRGNQREATECVCVCVWRVAASAVGTLASNVVVVLAMSAEACKAQLTRAVS